MPKVSGHKSQLFPYVPLGLYSGLEKWVFGFELPLTDPLWVIDLWKVEKKIHSSLTLENLEGCKSKN